MQFKNFPGKEPGEYIVKDEKGNKCARFTFWDAPGTKPSSCRNLKLSFPTEMHDRFHSKKVSLFDILRLAGIYYHVFHSVLEMTDKKGREMCKILSEEDGFNRLVYSELARELDDDLYDAKMHGRWIEIRIKKGGKKK